jgi:hypothetical protein
VSITPTSGFYERLVRCDVSELQSVPPYSSDELIALKGKSAAQVTFAVKTREAKLSEWSPDLPQHVVRALKGIADATWWLSNRGADSSNIGWPQSWFSASVRNRAQPELGQPVSLTDSRSRVLNHVAKTNGDPDRDIEEFDRFARKVCKSPELAYLTMLALLYRNTKTDSVLVKYKEARTVVEGHLQAIDSLAGISD